MPLSAADDAKSDEACLCLRRMVVDTSRHEDAAMITRAAAAPCAIVMPPARCFAATPPVARPMFVYAAGYDVCVPSKSASAELSIRRLARADAQRCQMKRELYDERLMMREKMRDERDAR